MDKEHVEKLATLAQQEKGCALQDALKNEDKDTHYATLASMAKRSAEMRKDNPSLPAVTVMSIGDSGSDDHFVRVDGKSIYRKSFGSSAGSQLARLLIGNVPECTEKK